MGYKGTIMKTNFTLGEISPRSFGRADADKPIFKNGAAILENVLIGEAGAVSLRPGTQYIANVKNQSPAAWVTSTAYVVGNNVVFNSLVYVCMIAHTSGTFATDLAAGDWALSNILGGQVRLERFTYNIAQEYVMEIGAQYIRFYANTGQVIVSSAPAWVTSTPYIVGNFVSNGGNIYYCVIAHTSGTFATDLAAGKWILQVMLEIPTIFNQADIFNLQTAQKADVMYIVHPNYFPQKLVRTSATSFTISNVPFFRGPFLDSNITATTIAASSNTGTTTLTASIGIFQLGHVGSLWRVQNGVVKITGFTSSTVVVGTVQPELNVPAVPNAWGAGQNYNIGDYVLNSGTIYRCLIGNTTDSSSVFATDLAANYWVASSGSVGNLGNGGTPTTDWSEGAFSAVRGYPSSVTFHEGRLVYAGTTYKPQTMYASESFAYDSFDKGTAQNADAWTYEIASNQSNGIRWLDSDNALQIGTSGGSVTASDGNPAVGITPSSPPNISYNDVYGTMTQQPVKLGGYSFFLQANKFYLRQLTYDLITSKFKDSNQMILADHILRDGFGAVQMASQSSPTDRIWVVRSDGQIAVLTRDPEQQVTGWTRVISGASDIVQSCLGYSGTIESICIIPVDGQDDQVWVVCKRSINGVFVRYIEIFTSELFNNYWEPVRMDCSLTYDNPITITNIDTTQNPILVTAPNHGFSLNDQIKIDGCIGAPQLNGGIFTVFNPTTNTFRLQMMSAPTITSQPVNTTVADPNTGTFTVVVTASPAATYQWQISLDNGVTWTNIVGATSASYTTPATVLADNGKQFRCVVSNGILPNAVSNAAILTVHDPVIGSLNVLIVAGGGGGGGYLSGGGGGAGGLLYQTAVNFTEGNSYTITVGAGGNGGANSGDGTATGHSGTNSTAFGYTAVGGGGGGGGGSIAAPAGTGLPGGSGGGEAGDDNKADTYGIGTTGQGHNGGANVPSGHYPAGGGGGAGAVGVSGTGTQCGAGGVGVSNSITGSAVYYAGGGGGGASNNGSAYGAGGNGGGGDGAHTASTPTAGVAGTANTGGGGGGAADGSTGGNGGSGVVIISYVTGTYGADGTGGVITHVGGNTIHTFNSSGTFIAPNGS